MKNRSFEVFCHMQIQNARSVGSSLKNATWLSLPCTRRRFPFQRATQLIPPGEEFCPTEVTPSLNILHPEFYRVEVPPSPDILDPKFCPVDIPLSPDISHSVPDVGWERRTFQLPQSDMSGLSDSVYPEIFSLSIQCRGVLLKLPDMCDRHFEIFCFRYLMSKSPNSPCNPPIIGFLSL